jgi:rod shape-determining protein MreC
MIDISSRHRPLALLASVVLAQVLLLAFQVKREHDVRLIRYWTVQAITPAERFGSWGLSKVAGVWQGYFALRNARTENERLHNEVDRLRLRNHELESQAAEVHRLSVLLNLREAHPEAPMIAAEVIGASADATSHTLFINRGERDRLRRNLGVITADGVVGKIVEVFPTSAQVLLINDKDSGVGALFAGSRTHGVVKGNGDPEPRMDYVVNDEKVKVGELVLTSGEDRIFPKDLPIGTVVGADPGNPFQSIRIQPAARLDRLEAVLVLLTQQDLTPLKTREASAAPVGSAAKAPAQSPAKVAPPKSPKPSGPVGPRAATDTKRQTPNPQAQAASAPAPAPAAAPPQ